jgi:hypothetical protein
MYLQVIAAPCFPCLPGPCEAYACDSSCTAIDPYTITFSFYNLTLSPGYTVSTNNQSDSSLVASPLVSDWFQPATYYTTVEAVTASGTKVTSSSNGATIDTTPPELVSAVEHFDVSFSEEEPVRFQGNNNTISARWRFQDRQSGVVGHEWAIGTVPYGTDVRAYESVGLSQRATTLGLQLHHNVTYYITVLAENGAGLVANITSEGVTYIATELNETLLQTLVNVEFTEILSFVDEGGEEFNIRTLDRDFHAGVSWTGVGPDIEEISECARHLEVL